MQIHLKGKNSKLIIILLTIVFTVFSCKTTKMGSGVVNLSPMSANEIIGHFEENAFEYDYLSIKKIKCHYADNKKSLNFRASIKAIKDEQIMISATKLGFPIARLLLSPDSVQFINYFEQKYLTDDYKAFSKIFKVNLDFETVQSILSNDILSEKDRKRVVSEEENMYVLTTRGNVQPVEKAYFNPSNFMISKYLVEDIDQNQYLKIHFDDFVSIIDKQYPSLIEVNYQSNKKSIAIEANMSNFSTTKFEKLSIKIPESYEKLKMK